MSRLLFSLSVLFALLCSSVPAHAGDEDEKQDTKKAAEQKTPEDTSVPKDAEAPALSMGTNEEPLPDYEEIKPQKPPAKARAVFKEKDLDENIDYSRIIDSVEAADPAQGVLPPALGFRGYRPNMVAVGVGDKTPGVGGIIEYSWNRIAMGGFASYLNTKGEDKRVLSYGFAGVYGLYRWLPFDMSPYFLMGVELGHLTDETLGGNAGLGMEARIYSGWTFLFGWTFHSTIHRGYLGGAVGWSF